MSVLRDEGDPLSTGGLSRLLVGPGLVVIGVRLRALVRYYRRPRPRYRYCSCESGSVLGAGDGIVAVG